MMFKLGQIESKVDGLHDLMSARVRWGDHTAETLTNRVSSLERSRSYVLGMAAAVGAGVSALIQFMKGS